MDSELASMLEKLSISQEKMSELSKKPHIIDNISVISKMSPSFTRLHYSLACTAPKYADIPTITKLIDKGVIKHENMFRAAYSYYERGIMEPIEEYIGKQDVSRERIVEEIGRRRNLDKKTILKELKKEMPYADFKVVMEELEKIKEEPAVAYKPVPNAVSEKGDKFGWLSEGEISLLNKPEENKQADERILQQHLERTNGKVVTRFPPEPNGCLHIGHVQAINLNFNYAEKYGGVTYLRYDDTNPRNEAKEHYVSILEDLEWLGFKPHKVTASSDYNDFMNEKTVHLIKKGKAYVCNCTLPDIRTRRQLFQKERENGRFDPTILSPYRNRTVDENLKEFSKMLNGDYLEGEAVLRFKMDLESRNPLMLDLIGSRIIDAIHPGKGRNWRVYPSYEFALCVADSLEDVTHSFCSREFLTRQEPYHWLLRSLEMYEPVQWEFSRLSLSNTVLSKRKISELVAKGINWDDPRLYTVKGMRRRGFTPDAINRFVRSVGLTFSESVVDVKILENYVRSELDVIAPRVFCVKNPLKVTINNLSKRRVEISGLGKSGVDVPFVVDVKKTVYIDASDYSEEKVDGFLRLTPDQPVGLIGLGCIRYIGHSGNDGIICELCDSKPKKHIQWLADLSVKVRLNLYKPLFNSFNPEHVGYLEDLNLESFECTDAYCDLRVKSSKPLDKFQFVRMGFFCCDMDSSVDNLVFNLTLPLRGS